MSEQAVALRYAHPLFDLAEEQKMTDKVYEDMQLFVETGEKNRELLAVLRSPVIKGHKKMSIIKALFEGKVQKLTMSMFEIMSRKNRDAILYELGREFVKLYQQKKGIQIVRIQTPTPLGEALKKELKEKLTKQLNKTIILKEEIKKDLLGGFILFIGHSQLDNSIKNSLQRLKFNFINTIYKN